MFDFGNSQNHWFYWHTRELLRKICFSLNGIYEKFCKNQPTFANYTLISPPIWEPFLFYIGRGNFEGHLWLPYYIKRLFYNGFRAKVKWRYEGRRFSTPPEPLLDGRNIGNSVLLWYWVKSIYDRRKKFCILGTKNTPTNLSIVDVFNVFNFVLWEEYILLHFRLYQRV